MPSLSRESHTKKPNWREFWVVPPRLDSPFELFRRDRLKTRCANRYTWQAWLIGASLPYAPALKTPTSGTRAEPSRSASSRRRKIRRSFRIRRLVVMWRLSLDRW